MRVREMNRTECRNFLSKSRLVRLACEEDGQPYIVPTYLVLHGNFLFGFSSVGRKIQCMRANPRVCIEADEILRHNSWTSVVLQGTYEELPDTPEHTQARTEAYEVLRTVATWWEPAVTGVRHPEATESPAYIFYRIHIERITGRQAEQN